MINYCHSHFTDEGTEAQRSKLQSWEQTRVYLTPKPMLFHQVTLVLTEVKRNPYNWSCTELSGKLALLLKLNWISQFLIPGHLPEL